MKQFNDINVEKVEQKEESLNKELNKILKAANKRHYQLLESISDGFCAINHQWSLSYINNSLEQIIGKTRKEILGESLWYVFPIETHPIMYKHISKAIEGRKVVRCQEYSPKFHKHLQINAYPTNDGLTIFIQNVTDQVRMIEALIESENRFHLIANNIGDIFWIASPDFEEWYYISPASKQILGLSFEDMNEKECEYWERIEAEDYQQLKAAYMQMHQKETIIEHRYKQPSKPLQWIRTKGFPVFKDGSLEVIVGITEDITSLIEREHLLSRSEKLSTVGQLAAGVAHEIRNPLTSIKGFLQIIQSEGKVPTSYTDIMLEELGRIESIVNEFLFLAKPQQEIKYTIQNIRPVLEQVISLIQAEANLKGIGINVDLIDITSCFVRCNANHLKQVFINVIKNAIEAVDNNGMITIKGSVQPREKVVLIKIVDNGPGMSQERLKKLGEPFFSTKEKGTGLGLMITRKLVEDHQGDLSFESELGKGTTAFVRLPLLTTAEACR